ncbi:MAG: hypothetical protein ACYTFK_05715 [Planctomycetota bacterium]
MEDKKTGALSSKDSLEDSLEILNNGNQQPPNNGQGHRRGRLKRGR